jgi:hypothetical protein
MKESKDYLIQLAELILPEEIFDFFDIIRIESTDKQVDIYLDEKYEKPEGYELVKLISKGFHSSICIQDFPLRDKALYLHVRRRRWYSESIGKTVERDWESVAKGTRLTRGFATFLKGLFGQLPD